MTKVLLPQVPASSHTTLHSVLLAQTPQRFFRLCTHHGPSYHTAFHALSPLRVSFPSLHKGIRSHIKIWFIRKTFPDLPKARLPYCRYSKLSLTSNLSLHNYNSPFAYLILRKRLCSPLLPLDCKLRENFFCYCILAGPGT